METNKKSKLQNILNLLDSKLKRVGKTVTKNNIFNKNHIIGLSCNILKGLFFIIIASTMPALAEDKKVIAITQIVEHPSLAEAKRGIIDVLNKNDYIFGKNLEIIEKNASGQIATSALIAKQFITQQPDVIVAISTPSAQSVISVIKKQNSNIPVIFSSVTDPIAAGIIANDKPAENFSGATDFPLIEEEIELINTLMPNDVKKIGLLYSAGEANSVKTVTLIKEALAKYNIEYKEVTVVNSSGVSQAFLSLVGKVDVVYIPSDNVIFSAMNNLVKLSRANKLPIFSSDPDSVKAGFTACIGYSQYSVGQKAGELVVRILKGERYLPISKPEKAEIFINKTSAKIMNIKINDNIFNIHPIIVE